MTIQNQLALISPTDLQKLIEDSVRKVLAKNDNDGPVGVVGVDGAAAYLGICRRTFYDLLKEHPDLDQACFRIGKRRLWRVEALEAWAKRQEGKPQDQTAAKEAA